MNTIVQHSQERNLDVTTDSSVIGGLIVLVLSSDRFVDGAATTARHFGMPSLLIGMVIVASVLVPLKWWFLHFHRYKATQV